VNTKTNHLLHSSALRRPRQRGFSLVELLVSASLVGIVVVPFLLFATTLVTKTIADSYSHSRTSQELNGAFREMNRVFEGASMVGVATANPSTELHLNYYNPNTGKNEAVGYRLVENAGKWNLVKLLGTNFAQQVSPYSTLKSSEVTLKSGSIPPTFDYCKIINGVTSCTNTPSLLTPAYLESVDFVRLNATQLNVVNVGLTTDKSQLEIANASTLGGVRLFLGKKFSQETGNPSTDALVKSAVDLQTLFGTTTTLNIFTASLEPRTGDSTLMDKELITDELSGEASVLDTNVVPANVRVVRVVSDSTRNKFAFIGTDAGTNNNPFVYVFNADTKVVTRVSAASTVAKSGVLGDDWPLAFDATSGNLFWVSNSNLMAYKPSDGTTVTVGALAATASSHQVSLIPDNSRGVVYVVMDNANDATPDTKIQVFNSQQLGAAVYNTDIKNVSLDHADAGVDKAQFNYVNAWVLNNSQGELNLLAKDTLGNARVIHLKPSRSGSTVSISNEVAFYDNTLNHTVNMDKLYPDQLVTLRTGNATTTYFMGLNTLTTRAVSMKTGNFSSTRQLILNSSDMGPGAVTGTGSYSNTALTSLSACLTSIGFGGSSAMTYQPRQLSTWFANNYYYGPTNNMFYSLCEQEGSLWLDAPSNTAYWGGNNENVLHRSVGSASNHTLSELNLKYDQNGTPRNLSDIGVGRSIGATSDNSAIVFGAEYGTGTGGGFSKIGNATMIHHFASNETTSLPNDRSAWVMPIPNSQKILFTYKDTAANRQVLGAYDACTKTVTTSPFYVKDDFAEKMKNGEILAVDSDTFTLIVNDYNDDVQFWNFGVPTTKSGRDGNFTANTPSLLKTDSRYIKVSGLGADVLSGEKIVATTQSEGEAFALVKATGSGCSTTPAPRLVRFKCKANDKDSKSSANLCRYESALPLPASPLLDTPGPSGTDLVINEKPGNTAAYVLNAGVVYTIPNRNDTAALSSYTALFSPGASATTFVKSRKTGNFYVLLTNGVATINGKDGLKVEGYTPTGGRNTALDFLLPLDAASVGDASKAFNGGAYNAADEGVRMEFDETRRYIVLYTDVPGRKMAYTFEAPANHPM
jgi:prepilin-type N-terminal cleavage/methylation domain-containing protein